MNLYVTCFYIGYDQAQMESDEFFILCTDFGRKIYRIDLSKHNVFNKVLELFVSENIGKTIK